MTKNRLTHFPATLFARKELSVTTSGGSNGEDVMKYDEHNLEYISLSLLSLANNDIVGPIPPSLGQLSGLIILSLGFNRITSIPAEIGMQNYALFCSESL